jgi:hypothetical protein
MSTKTILMLLASAALLFGATAGASAQSNAPTDAITGSASTPPPQDWRERAMQARAEVPDAAPRGRLHDPEGLDDPAEREDGANTGDLGPEGADGRKGKGRGE